MMAAVAEVKAASQGRLRLNAFFDTLNSFSRPARVEQHTRKTIEAGHLTDVIEGLKRPKQSTITIQSPGVLKHTIRGLRSYPQKAQWSKKSVARALSQSRTIAALLEAEHAKAKKLLINSESHKTPEVLGTYLELAAVHAYKFQNAQDVDGKVKAAASRLLSAFESSKWSSREWEAPTAGQVDVVLENLPAWHGLSLARRVLGKDMPKPDLANRVIESYGSGLEKVVEQIRAKQPQENTYGHEAVRVYDNCIRV